MISPERFTRRQNSAISSGTQPGPLVTASATPHTLGSWTSLVAVCDFDVFMCGVTLKETAATGVDTSMLVNIGTDPAGGTTYTVVIPNILAAGAPLSTSGAFKGPLWFPCFFAKGSQVAAQAQALVGSQTVRVAVSLIGGKNRSNPFPHRGRIQSYGADLATSGGTAMADAAIDTKGAWTQLGADTTRRHSGLVVSTAVGDGAVTSNRFLLDVGVDPAGGTSYSAVISDIAVHFINAESGTMIDSLSCLLGIDIPTGSSIAARAASQAANGQSDLEVVVYAF